MLDEDPESDEFISLLRGAQSGEREPLERIAPHVLAELKRVAGARLGRQGPPEVAQVEALANETWRRLLQDKDMVVRDRIHFFAIAASKMRGILVDEERRRHRRRGGIVG